VQASFTLGIKPQLDGKLDHVLFKEGDIVRKDDVLAKIDPGSTRRLESGEAQKKEDEARLISAMKDLQRSRTLVDKAFETAASHASHQFIATVDADKAAIDTAQTNLDYT
jgi:membrane fusion protein, multidrug efflux system